MALEIIRTKTQTIIECPLKPSTKRYTVYDKWTSGTIHPFFPSILFAPKDITKKQIQEMRPYYKAQALEDAKYRMAELKRRGNNVKLITRSDRYEVLVEKKNRLVKKK